MIEAAEEWRSLAPLGFPGYDVSSLGLVRSYKKKAGHGWIIADAPQRILRQTTEGGGYPQVTLSNTATTVHVLVLRAFAGERPAGHDAHHRNGIRADHRLSNLEWVEAPAHRSSHSRGVLKRSFPGVRNPSAKLTEADVREIRAAIAAGKSHRSLGDRYGVSHTAIKKIGRRETWAHVPDDPPDQLPEAAWRKPEGASPQQARSLVSLPAPEPRRSAKV